MGKKIDNILCASTIRYAIDSGIYDPTNVKPFSPKHLGVEVAGYGVVPKSRYMCCAVDLIRRTGKITVGEAHTIKNMIMRRMVAHQREMIRNNRRGLVSGLVPETLFSLLAHKDDFRLQHLLDWYESWIVELTTGAITVEGN